VTFAPFDVVVVPFPFSDRLAEKRRPALVVSAPALETQCGWVWVAMITSSVHKLGFADREIGDIGAAGLPSPSMVRAGKLTTVEPGRILRRAGRLSARDQSAVQEVLKSCAAF
jgi:mRNA interferase MazF